MTNHNPTIEQAVKAITATIAYLEERGIRDKGVVGRTVILPALDTALTSLRATQQEPVSKTDDGEVERLKSPYYNMTLGQFSEMVCKLIEERDAAYTNGQDRISELDIELDNQKILSGKLLEALRFTYSCLIPMEEEQIIAMLPAAAKDKGGAVTFVNHAKDLAKLAIALAEREGVK